MLLVFPVLVLLLFTFGLTARQPALGLRRAFLLAAVFLGGMVILVTEAMSFFHCLIPRCIEVFWAALVLLAVFFCLCSGGMRGRSDDRKATRLPLSGWDIFCFVSGGFLLAGTFFAASLSVPNNWDSMTYHLPRVMHWLDNHSLAYYPTNIDRQNVYLPGAEILVLHAYVLGGGDRWVHCVQWLALLGGAAGVSLLAAHLGAGTGGQLMGGLFFLTLPMAILQSLTTQNDLVVAFWVICCLCFLSDLGERWSVTSLAGAAGAFAMALVTKGTAFILIPFVCLHVWELFRSGHRIRVGILLSVLLAAGILLSFGHASRHVEGWKYGGGSGVSEFLMKRHDPVAITSNVLRNVASEMALPFGAWNEGVRNAIDRIHRVLGISAAASETTSGAFFCHAASYADDPGRLCRGLSAFILVRGCWGDGVLCVSRQTGCSVFGRDGSCWSFICGNCQMAALDHAVPCASVDPVGADCRLDG